MYKFEFFPPKSRRAIMEDIHHFVEWVIVGSVLSRISFKYNSWNYLLFYVPVFKCYHPRSWFRLYCIWNFTNNYIFPIVTYILNNLSSTVFLVELHNIVDDDLNGCFSEWIFNTTFTSEGIPNFLIYSYIIEELIHQSLLMVKFPLIKFKARIAPFEVLEVNAHEWQSQKQ